MLYTVTLFPWHYFLAISPNQYIKLKIVIFNVEIFHSVILSFLHIIPCWLILFTDFLPTPPLKQIVLLILTAYFFEKPLRCVIFEEEA